MLPLLQIALEPDDRVQVEVVGRLVEEQQVRALEPELDLVRLRVKG